MVCTEEEAAIDSMIDAFRARNCMTLRQLMEVDSMYVNLDRFSQGRRDPQDVLVPVAEERPYLHKSKAEIELRKRLGLWEEDGEDE